MDWTTLIIIAVLVGCCLIAMLFMGKKSKPDGSAGDKHERR